MRGQILIDQGEQNDPRRRLYFGDSLVELHLAAYEGINMLNRRLPFVLRRDGAAGGNQGFARRVGNQMQMEVVTLQESSCLATACPKFKEIPGRNRDNWRRRSLATILLDKPTQFIHRHRRLNNKTLVPVNLGDRDKAYRLKNRTCPYPIRTINEKLKFQSPGTAC